MNFRILKLSTAVVMMALTLLVLTGMKTKPHSEISRAPAGFFVPNPDKR